MQYFSISLATICVHKKGSCSS